MTATQAEVTETRRIANELRLLHDGTSWLGPSLKDLLGDVDEARARSRPLADAHTIWELVLHMAAWLRIARERLSATGIRDASEAENWPAMQGSWDDAKALLAAETTALEQAILRFPEERLDERAPANQPQTFYVLLHGVIQHSAYHAGQIAIVKRG
ncbi:MAG TPA: DinB family protein [Bryobacteraceae bacterium]|nr:DinB family protein [Bryobacteraceae bacterium]